MIYIYSDSINREQSSLLYIKYKEIFYKHIFVSAENPDFSFQNYVMTMTCYDYVMTMTCYDYVMTMTCYDYVMTMTCYDYVMTMTCRFQIASIFTFIT